MKFVFYTSEVDTFNLDAKNPQISAGAYAIKEWQSQNLEQCMYVIKNASNLGFATHHNYYNLSVSIRVTGEMDEKDYILYRLRY